MAAILGAHPTFYLANVALLQREGLVNLGSEKWSHFPLLILVLSITVWLPPVYGMDIQGSVIMLIMMLILKLFKDCLNSATVNMYMSHVSENEPKVVLPVVNLPTFTNSNNASDCFCTSVSLFTRQIRRKSYEAYFQSYTTKQFSLRTQVPLTRYLVWLPC